MQFLFTIVTKKMKPNYLIFILFFLPFFTTSCSKPTVACFTYSQITNPSDSIVTFNAACTENASYFTWNFGDNSKDTTTTSLIIKHKFNKTGPFNVTLNAKRKDGVSSGSEPVASRKITVR